MIKLASFAPEFVSIERLGLSGHLCFGCNKPDVLYYATRSDGEAKAVEICLNAKCRYYSDLEKAAKVMKVS